ncbi:DMT family transporter [Lysinibacter cavernae]|uniref:Transporter family-2 protein n=1 Tax=Lysinibacter cavernae TaxID=1640652 RepID=A0A7X5TSR2_9MICO|nr:DMT family transporter [Lysinibacter cavernae]NIH53781.1 transporter family-2 protein [Lysinibacter cavernae]
MATKSLRVPTWVAIIIVMLCGALVAVQTRLNGQFGAVLGDGFVAATYSFGSGLVIMTILVLCSKQARSGLADLWAGIRGGTFPWWAAMGGAAGAFLVLSQGLSAGILGVALFTVGVVAGQTTFGVFLDAWGVGPSGKIPPNRRRLAAVGLCLLAVAITVSGQLTHAGSLVWFIMPLLAGLGTAWQPAVNGRVRSLTNSAVSATFVNFVVGTLVLATITLVRGAFVGFPTEFPPEPWYYVGGLVGCIFIGGMAVFVKQTGVLLLGLASISGQLCCSLVLDLLLPVGSSPVTAGTVIGVIVALVAVGVSSIRPRRTR